VRRVDDLDAVAVDRGEGGAQGFVPGHQRGERAVERAGVERAAQAQHGRGDVLGAARFELVEEPKPLLTG